MQNLKKALSLLLTLTMLLGMFAFGGPSAGALASDFTDAADIKYTAAVDVVSSLGAMIGNEGKFEPNRAITRAELSVLLCRILNGGELPIISANAKADFTDMPSPDYDWAHPYVAYCTELGILAGDAGIGGTFRPGDAVTMVEAAKAILVAIGYRAEVAGFIGENWVTNVAVAASACDPRLFDGLINPVLTDALTRDAAAQMIFNALLTNMKTYNNLIVSDGKGGYYTETRVQDFWLNGQEGSVAWTLLSYKFGASRITGIITANEFAGIDGSAKTKAGITRIAGSDWNFEVTTDLDMLGLEVDIFAKRDPRTLKVTVFGTAIPTANNTVVAVPYNQNIANYSRSNGVTLPNVNAPLDFYINYDLPPVDHGTGNNTVYQNLRQYSRVPQGDPANNGDDVWTNISCPSGITLRVIDNDGDGIADIVFAVEPTLAAVTAINNAGDLTLHSRSGAIDARDIVYLTKDFTPARGDLVLYYEIEGIVYVSVPETYQGVVTAINSSGSTVTVGDKAISRSRLVKVNASSNDFKFGFATNDKLVFANSSTAANNINGVVDGLSLGDEYLYYLDSDGNALALEEVDAGVGQYILVTAAGTGAGAGLTSIYQVRGYLSDGSSEAVYDVNVKSSAAGALKTSDDSWQDVFSQGQNTSGITFDCVNGDDVPVVARYTVNSSGVLTLYDYPDCVSLDDSIYYSSISGGQIRFGSDRATDRTVIFYVYEGRNGFEFSSVVTGVSNIAEVKSSTSGAEVATIVKGGYIQAMLVYTESEVTAGSKNIGYFGGSHTRKTVTDNTGKDVEVYEFRLLTTDKVEPYVLINVEYDKFENCGKGFYEYSQNTNGLYTVNRMAASENYYAVVSAEIDDVEGNSITLINGLETTVYGDSSRTDFSTFVSGEDFIYTGTPLYRIAGITFDDLGVFDITTANGNISYAKDFSVLVDAKTNRILIAVSALGANTADADNKVGAHMTTLDYLDDAADFVADLNGDTIGDLTFVNATQPNAITALTNYLKKEFEKFGPDDINLGVDVTVTTTATTELTAAGTLKDVRVNLSKNGFSDSVVIDVNFIIGVDPDIAIKAANKAAVEDAIKIIEALLGGTATTPIAVTTMFTGTEAKEEAIGFLEGLLADDDDLYGLGVHIEINSDDWDGTDTLEAVVVIVDKGATLTTNYEDFTAIGNIVFED